MTAGCAIQVVLFVFSFMFMSLATTSDWLLRRLSALSDCDDDGAAGVRINQIDYHLKECYFRVRV